MLTQANGADEMRIVQHDGGKAALEEMAGPASAGVDEVGVAPVGFADGAAQVAGSRGHPDQVHMVGHQAVGPHRDLGLQRLLGQQVEVDLMVAILKEDGLAPVAALRDMMRKPRNHDPRQTRHAKNRTMESASRPPNSSALHSAGFEVFQPACFVGFAGRGGGIRTPGPLLPKQITSFMEVC